MTSSGYLTQITCWLSKKETKKDKKKKKKSNPVQADGA